MKFLVERFPNQELHITLKGRVKDKECLIEGLISPPEVNLVTFLILAHTLKIEGAKKVIGYIPYLAYARHDKKEAYKSRIAALLGRLLAAAGVDMVITLDIHSPIAQELFPIPFSSQMLQKPISGSNCNLLQTSRFFKKMGGPFNN